MTAAEAAVEEAQQKLEQARAVAADAEDKVRSEEAAQQAAAVESPQHAPVAAHEELVRRTRALLQILESGRVVAGRDLPDELVQSMVAAHEVMEEIAPTPAARVDEPLERDQPEGATQLGRRTRSADEAFTSGANEVFAICGDTDPIAELDGVAEDDTEALLAIAMRLKRARC